MLYVYFANGFMQVLLGFLVVVSSFLNPEKWMQLDSATLNPKKDFMHIEPYDYTKNKLNLINFKFHFGINWEFSLKIHIFNVGHWIGVLSLPLNSWKGGLHDGRYQPVWK
jgi:hypothetical protein